MAYNRENTKKVKKVELTFLFIILGIAATHIVVFVLALLWLNR